MRHGQSWMDVFRALLDFPLSITTFVVTVTWWVAGAAGLLYWFWGRFLPVDEDSRGLGWLLGLDGLVPEWLVHLPARPLLLLTAPWVVRALVMAHVGLERFALLASRPARLRARIDDLTASRAAVVDAESQALRRIERDLHDGPQQRLVRTTMDVQAGRCGDSTPATPRPRASRSRRPSSRCRPASASCARCRAGSRRRCWPTGGWRPRSPHWRARARCGCRSRSGCPRTTGTGSSSRPPPTSSC